MRVQSLGANVKNWEASLPPRERTASAMTDVELPKDQDQVSVGEDEELTCDDVFDMDDAGRLDLDTLKALLEGAVYALMHASEAKRLGDFGAALLRRVVAGGRAKALASMMVAAYELGHLDAAIPERREPVRRGGVGDRRRPPRGGTHV